MTAPLHVVEVCISGKWQPTSVVTLDGRTIGKLLKSCKFQMPDVKFRKAVYARDTSKS